MQRGRPTDRPTGRVPLVENFGMNSFLHYMAVVNGEEPEGADEIKSGIRTLYDKYVRDVMGLLETVGPGSLSGGELPRRTPQQEVFIDKICILLKKPEAGLPYLAYRLGAAVAVAARAGGHFGATTGSSFAGMVSMCMRTIELLSTGLPRVPNEAQSVRKSYHPDVFKQEELIDMIMRRRVADLARSALVKPYTSSSSSVLPSSPPVERNPSGPRAPCPPLLAAQLWSMYKTLADFGDYRTGAGHVSAKVCLTDSPLFLLANTASFEYLSRHSWSCGSPSSDYYNAKSRRAAIAGCIDTMAELPEVFGWKEMPSFVAARVLALWTMGMLRALPELAREEAFTSQHRPKYLVESMVSKLYQLCINLCANGSVHPSDVVQILGHTILDPMSAIFNTSLGVRDPDQMDRREMAMLNMAYAVEVQSAGPFLLLMLSGDPVARRMLLDRYRHVPGGPSMWACPAIRGPSYSILGHAVRRLTVSGSQCWERLGGSGRWTDMDTMNMLYRLGMMRHLGTREEQAIMRLAASQPLRVYIILNQAVVKDEPFPGMRPELGRMFDLLAWHRRGDPESLARAAERSWGLLAHPLIDLGPMVDYALKVLPTRSSVPWGCLAIDGLTNACLVSDMAVRVASLGRTLHLALQSKSAAAAQNSASLGAVSGANTPSGSMAEETKARASVQRIQSWKDRVKSATRALLRIHIPMPEKGAVRALSIPSRPEGLAAALNVEVDWEGLGEAKAAERGWRRPGVGEFLEELRLEAGRVGAVVPKALRRLETGDQGP